MQHLQSATSLGENIQGLIKDLLMTFNLIQVCLQELFQQRCITMKAYKIKSINFVSLTVIIKQRVM